MSVGDTFGEISFVKGLGASASVIAETDTEVYIVEGYFVKVLGDMCMLPAYSLIQEQLIAHRSRLHWQIL